MANKFVRDRRIQKGCLLMGLWLSFDIANKGAICKLEFTHKVRIWYFEISLAINYVRVASVTSLEAALRASILWILFAIALFLLATSKYAHKLSLHFIAATLVNFRFWSSFIIFISFSEELVLKAAQEVFRCRYVVRQAFFFLFFDVFR